MRPRPRLVFLAGFFAAALSSSSFGVTYPHFWSQRYGDGGFQAVNAVTTDGSGNVYAIGTFSGTINLGGSDLVSAGSFDIFVAKFSPTGAHVWSQRFGDASSQEGREIVATPSGQIVIAGHFQGSMTVPGFPVLTSAGGTDIYLVRLGSDGVATLANRYGDASFQYCNALATDTNDGVAIVGAFLSSINFGGSNLVSAGDYDIFVARFNSGGVHLWSFRFGDAVWNDVSSVAIDANFNVYLGGHFSGTFSFGGPNVTGSGDVYVTKLAVNGSWVWSKDFGDAASQYCNAIAVDDNGNVFLTGYLDGTINFGGSDLTGVGDCYLVKFDTAGNHLWSKRFGLDNNAQDGRSLDVDSGGNVIFAGHYIGQIDLGGGQLIFQGGVDLFLAKFSPAGDHMWSRSFGNSLTQQIPFVTVDFDDSIIYAGQFDGTLNFGGGNLSSAGGTDAYVAKIGGDSFEPNITSITDIGNDQGRKVKIRFVRSGADAALWPTPVTRYVAFRRDDDPPSASFVTHDDGWTEVGSVSAFGTGSYGIDVPTIGDSTITNGMYQSSFFIRAATGAPTTFFDSDVDSGYSVDNLSPGIPLGFAYNAGNLTWNESTAEDFDYFSVYGGATNVFGAAAFINYTVAPSLNVSASPNTYYFVTATDFSGNEGKPAVINAATGVGGAPSSYVLSVSAYPNPFNPETTIRYTVPSTGRVTIAVYDARGVRVRTLLDEDRSSGAFALPWDGRSDDGTTMSSGVYFARVAHPSGTKSYKMVLLK